MLGFYDKSCGVVMLKVGLHQRSSKVVKLDFGLHYGYPNIDQEVSQDGEARNEDSPWESEGGGIHDGASPWEYQRA